MHATITTQTPLILAPYVRIGFQNNILYLGFGSIQQTFKKKLLQNAILKALNLFIEPMLIEDAYLELRKQDIDEELANKVIEKIKHNFLIPNGLYCPQERHSRSSLFYSLSGANAIAVQELIASMHIAIVGCGGIGNLIAVTLATAGVKKFTLVDKDVIELSNLSRQIMFTEHTNGKFKVDELAEALKARNSEVDITTIKEFITEENLATLKGTNFIVLSGDQEHLVKLVNRFSVQQKIPFMNAGYIEDIAVWGPLVIPGVTGCLDCHNHLVSEEGLSEDQISTIRRINSRYKAPSVGPINMLSSSLASLDILRFLGKFGTPASLNTRIGLWSHNLQFEKQNYEKNPNCHVCGISNKDNHL